jgi:hypothetical protein
MIAAEELYDNPPLICQACNEIVFLLFVRLFINFSAQLYILYATFSIK